MQSKMEVNLNKHYNALEEKIDGVFDAQQDRSRQTRDSFIHSGIILLNQVGFNDLKVGSLTSHSGRSVGSFYKRFSDKDAFFRALQSEAIARNTKVTEKRLGKELHELVDTLVDIFSSETRGVLRESLLRILEPQDAWAPMRKSGQDIQQRIVDRFQTFNMGNNELNTERKVRFCYQVVVGVLQNDLVNDFHAISTKDQSIGKALKAVVFDHMCSDSKY
jgi:AcrR family transcriptional regulator